MANTYDVHINPIYRSASKKFQAKKSFKTWFVGLFREEYTPSSFYTFGRCWLAYHNIDTGFFHYAKDAKKRLTQLEKLTKEYSFEKFNEPHTYINNIFSFPINDIIILIHQNDKNKINKHISKITISAICSKTLQQSTYTPTQLKSAIDGHNDNNELWNIDTKNMVMFDNINALMPNGEHSYPDYYQKEITKAVKDFYNTLEK